MNQTGTTDRIRASGANRPTLPPPAQASWSELFTFNQETMRRLTGMIQLGFGILNGLIGLRFLLKLMAADPANVFASFIYTVTHPFLWVFLGLTRTPSFQGIVIEFYDLVAIAVYAMLGWIIVRALWLMFGRLR